MAVATTDKYPKAVKIYDAQLVADNLSRHSFHGEWNYTFLRAGFNPAADQLSELFMEMRRETGKE